MSRRKKIIKLLIGLTIGILLDHYILLLSQHKLVGTIGNRQQCKIAKNYDNMESLKTLEDTNDDINMFENRSQHRTNLLFVGVMTASKYVNSRAMAIQQTWARDVPGKLLFFGGETLNSGHLPIVALQGVQDAAYPPQQKAFLMLKYMHDHHLNDFEWFMRADDDVYVKMDRLEALLRSVDSRKAWFVGQTGRGTVEELGLLDLAVDENYCMGGPGVILSRETLRLVAPHLQQCLSNNLVTSHEDVELGRCVRKFAGTSCTWSYEMQVILYHNQSGSTAFSGDLKQKVIHRAITLHPVKEPKSMYRLHRYIQRLKIQKLQETIINIHREITTSMSRLGHRRESLQNAELVQGLPLFPSNGNTTRIFRGDSNILGAPPGLNRYVHKLSSKEILDWELFVKNIYSYTDLNPRRRLGSTMKEGLNDVVREVMELINVHSKQRGRIIDFKDIRYGYWRLDPIHGVDLILDLLLVYHKYRGHKLTVQVRKHAYIQQTFTDVAIREVDIEKGSSTPINQFYKKLLSSIKDNLVLPILQQYPSKISKNTKHNDEIINFILPLSGRLSVLKRFLVRFESVCIQQQEAASLNIVLYRNDPTYSKSMRIIRELQEKYRSIDVIRTFSIANGNFSRAQALNVGVHHLNRNDLMLLIDVDIVFDANSLQRIRANTKQTTATYFPIVFSLYNLAFVSAIQTKLVESIMNQNVTCPLVPLIQEELGFWRQFGFGIVAIYKSDYLDLGGLNLLISGWGLEDVTFYDTAIKSHLNIVRSTDPGLVHMYHPVYCDNSLNNAQKVMCYGTKASTMGSLRQIQEHFLKFFPLIR